MHQTLYFFLDEEDMLGVSDERKKDSADYKERLTTMINTQKMFSSLWETVRNQRANIKEWNETPLHVSHNYFVATCLFNVLFLVCFLHREYLTSLIFLLLLFVTLILWYIKINAWYVITPLKSDDEIMVRD